MCCSSVPNCWGVPNRKRGFISKSNGGENKQQGSWVYAGLQQHGYNDAKLPQIENSTDRVFPWKSASFVYKHYMELSMIMTHILLLIRSWHCVSIRTIDDWSNSIKGHDVQSEALFGSLGTCSPASQRIALLHSLLFLCWAPELSNKEVTQALHRGITVTPVDRKGLELRLLLQNPK